MTFIISGNTISSVIGEGLYNSNHTKSDYGLNAQIVAHMNDDQNLQVSRPWFHTLALCDTDPLRQHQATNPPFPYPSVHPLWVFLTPIAGPISCQLGM